MEFIGNKPDTNSNLKEKYKRDIEIAKNMLAANEPLEKKITYKIMHTNYSNIFSFQVLEKSL